LHAPSPHNQKWQATPDDRRSAVLRHLREDECEWQFAERKLYVDWIEQREMS
jgi:hypothetical protein